MAAVVSRCGGEVMASEDKGYNPDGPLMRGFVKAQEAVGAGCAVVWIPLVGFLVVGSFVRGLWDMSAQAWALIVLLAIAYGIGKTMGENSRR